MKSPRKIQLTPFRVQDYQDAVAEGAVEGDTDISVDGAKLAQLYIQRGVGFTLRVHGRVAACFGVMIQWPGLGRVWALVTPTGREHPQLVHRAALRALRGVPRQLGLRRVEAEVRADFELGRRWAECLGFQIESEMPLYGPRGETFIRYVLFP